MTHAGTGTFSLVSVRLNFDLTVGVLSLTFSSSSASDASDRFSGVSGGFSGSSSDSRSSLNKLFFSSVCRIDNESYQYYQTDDSSCGG